MENRQAELEHREGIALHIYERLRTIAEDPRFRVTLEAIDDAVFIDTNTRERIKVMRFPDDPFARELLLRRGFTKQEVQEGRFTVVDISPAVPNSPRRYTIRAVGLNGKLRCLSTTASREDVAFDSSFQPYELTERELLALGVTSELSMWPYLINEKFGSYEAFREALRTTTPQADLSMIELTRLEWGVGGRMERRVLYNRGIHTFVRAVQRAQDGLPLDSAELLIVQPYRSPSSFAHDLDRTGSDQPQ